MSPRRGRRAPERHAPAKPTPARHAPGIGAVLAAALVIAGLVVHIRWLWFVCDDAFISFRYARNLVDGAGLVFNPGERVEGYTNFLWTLVSAGVLWLGARPEIVVPILSALCAVITVVLVLARGRWAWPAVAAAALLAASSGFAAWASGGLETAAFTLCVTAFLIALAGALDRDDARAVVATAPLAALVVLERPDGHLFVAVAAVALAARVARGRLSAKTFALWLALWLVPDLVYQAWRVAYYGHMLPNSFALRGQTLPLAAGLAYVGASFVRLGVVVWALPFVVLALRRRPLALTGAIVPLAAAAFAVQAAYVALVGGDFMDLGRYLVPALPVAAILAGAAWTQVIAEIPARSSAPRVAAAAAATALVVGWGAVVSRDAQGRHSRGGLDSIGLLRAYAHEWTLVGEHLRIVAAPSDTIAITAAGIVPYVSSLYTIDELGLVAPDLATYEHRGVRRTGHARRIDPASLRARRPQFLLDEPHLTPRPWQLRTDLFANADWARSWESDYELVSVRLPDADTPFYTYAVRRDVIDRLR